MKTVTTLMGATLVASLFLLTSNIPLPAAGTARQSTGKTESRVSHDQKTVNINRADVQTLTTLKGVGPQLAERIVEFRKNNGPFKRAEDITSVKGVGARILERNKNHIAIE